MESFKNVQNISAFDILSDFVKKLKNIDFPVDRFYNRSHIWIKFEDELAKVGISGSIVFIFAPLTGVILLPRSSFLKLNTPCAWVMHRDGIITIRSPVQGEICEVNEDILKFSDILNRDPYSAGWLFKIKVEGNLKSTDILSQQEFLKLYYEKIESLSRRIGSILNEPFVKSSIITLQDGRRVVETIKELLGAKRYLLIVSKILEM